MNLTSRKPFFFFTLIIIFALCASYADADSHRRPLRRQIQNSDDASSATPTRTPTRPSSPSPSRSQEPSPATSEAAPTSTEPSSTPTQEPVTEEPPSATPTSRAPEPTVQPTEAEPTTALVVSTKTPTREATEAPAILTTIITVSGSSTISRVITSSARSSQSSATDAPSVNGSETSSGSSGVTPGQRRIIIGVVVGVGGSILIGALAFVAWRIWGKKKHDTDEDMYDPNAAVKEPSSSSSNANPFKSTLDQYHNPAPVNTASNF